ncbi:hypothetical protein EZV62_027043 [Acer yangbiense]|uniref:Transposase MuDR plant domain-containing protein n=1 Tax=Acer yangbiense TaxID=1000413 RepID=A0A5C7GTE7_9ROSI|nr:hypothetical protein EZV62_027043 [Acer yangbiense]
MGDSTFILNGTASFMGKRFELGRFDKDYMCLKDLWDSAMHEVLGLEALVAAQQFPIQQPDYNLNQHPNLEQKPIILIDSSSSPFEDDANYNLDGGSYQSTINSDDEVPNNASEDKVPNDASEDEVPNDNDSADENDGLSDVNEDDIADEEVGQLFRNSTHFREILLDYSIQEGFKLKRIKNEKMRITVGCESQGCHWRVHGSPTFDRVTYMLKTLRNDHNCLAVSKNMDVTSIWLGKRFQMLIKENPNMHIKVLGSVILRQCGVEVPDHTLYRAKRYALNIRDEDHKQSYNKLYRFYLSFQAQKVGYLQACRPFIGLDGCHLKGPYGGVLVCAIAIDANCGVYPVALSVVEIECLDRIMPALNEVWPNHNSRFYGRHILQNMLGRFKIYYLKDLFWPSTTSPNKVAFLQAMDEIKQTSPEAHAYLNGIPLETWAVHAFDTICKTDHNTNNVVEAFNSWMNKHRTLSMLTMMETVRKKFMKRILSRYEAAGGGSSSTHPGAASTHAEPDSTHPRHASTHARHATRTSLSGSSTIAASPRISGTITRVLWFPSTQEGTSTPRDTTNYVSTQPLTQGAPQPSQQSQP